MNNKQRCLNCNTLNPLEITRCSFCNNPFQVNTLNTEDKKLNDLTQQLHNLVEKLSPLQKNKLLRHIEDNFI